MGRTETQQAAQFWADGRSVVCGDGNLCCVHARRVPPAGRFTGTVFVPRFDGSTTNFSLGRVKNFTQRSIESRHWELIRSDDPATIERLQNHLHVTQAEAVYEFIEGSCWTHDVPHLTGHRGTAEERRDTLCRLYDATNKPPKQHDLSWLTPLEYQLAEALLRRR